MDRPISPRSRAALLTVDLVLVPVLAAAVRPCGFRRDARVRFVDEPERLGESRTDERRQPEQVRAPNPRSAAPRASAAIWDGPSTITRSTSQVMFCASR